MHIRGLNQNLSLPLPKLIVPAVQPVGCEAYETVQRRPIDLVGHNGIAQAVFHPKCHFAQGHQTRDFSTALERMELTLEGGPGFLVGRRSTQNRALSADLFQRHVGLFQKHLNNFLVTGFVHCTLTQQLCTQVACSRRRGGHCYCRRNHVFNHRLNGLNRPLRRRLNRGEQRLDHQAVFLLSPAQEGTFAKQRIKAGSQGGLALGVPVAASQQETRQRRHSLGQDGQVLLYVFARQGFFDQWHKSQGHLTSQRLTQSQQHLANQAGTAPQLIETLADFFHVLTAGQIAQGLGDLVQVTRDQSHRSLNGNVGLAFAPLRIPAQRSH